MHIEVPWGTTTTPLEIDDGHLGRLVEGHLEEARDPVGALMGALAVPGRGFADFLADAPSPLLVVVNDGTRPTPSAEVLSALRPELEEWLRPSGRELSFVLATGTHRTPSAEEVSRVLGADLVAVHGERIFCHAAKDEKNLAYVGRTARGTVVWVNRLLVEAGSVLLINSVEPHYFAGYTGGRKSLVPGLAGCETVRANHRLALEPGAEYLALVGNPVHEDLEEATALSIGGKHVYSIQLVLSKDGKVGFAAAGSLEETFRSAVAAAEREFVVELDRAYEVVVAVAQHPLDCDFYQTNKAIQSGARALKEGGILVVVSECPLGLGDNQALFDMLAATEAPAQALERARGTEYRLGGHQTVRVVSILERAEIWVVSSLDEAKVRAMHMTPFANVQTAVDAALAKKGEEAQVLLLTTASLTVPRVHTGGRLDTLGSRGVVDRR